MGVTSDNNGLTSSLFLFGNCIRRYNPPMIRTRTLLISAFFLVFYSAGTADSMAQGRTAEFGRARTYDVKHYKVEVKLDPSRKTITATTTVTLSPLGDGLTTVVLDAERLRFSSVTDDAGRKLSFSVSPGKVTVRLGRIVSKGTDISLRLSYTGTPAKGIYFVPMRQVGSVSRAPQIWTQGEPEEARHWIPSYDFPDDKATTEQILTVPSGYTVVANGRPLGSKANADGTESHHFRMDVPHSTYLISFVVGRFTRTETLYRGIPLGVYVYPDRPSMGRPAFELTDEMMRIFEELTATDFPFNKYDQTIVSDFTFGGMENITATTLSDRDVAIADSPLGKPLVEDLVAHELAHSWFGNLVTCSNWAELWLNEGFATFMEAAYRERMYGRDAYLEKIRQDAGEYFFYDARRPARHGLYNRLARPDDSIFNPIVYKKGSAVVHMLRETVGDEAFWKSVRLYLDRHRFGNVGSEDLRKAFEEASGNDLGWFFRQWVYGTGHPEIRVAGAFTTSGKTLRLTVSQVHRAGGLTPATFRMDLDVEVRTASGSRRFTLEVRRPVSTVTVPLEEKPLELSIDPDFKVPVKVVRSSTLSVN